MIKLQQKLQTFTGLDMNLVKQRHEFLSDGQKFGTVYNLHDNWT